MRQLFGVIALFYAGQANATTYRATLVGTLINETTVREASAYYVGSTIKLTTTFSDRYAAETPFGYNIAGFYSYDLTPVDFVITSDGGNWGTRDDKSDGEDIVYRYEYSVDKSDGTGDEFQYELGSPAIAFANGKVIGIETRFVPFGNVPSLYSGTVARGYKTCYNIYTDAEIICRSTWQPSVFSDQFYLLSEALYFNTYSGSDFVGIWDFAGSSVVALPEPASWALMVAGFGFTGTSLRRRSSARIAAKA
ncbi:MAG: PEPxxWA-CTERM sorting domain-containing protein [Burkholderiales bacterium]|nr:PEPxxWA-CTERM sorting domain-containing protein [Anaerolineae bacterium]